MTKAEFDAMMDGRLDRRKPRVEGYDETKAVAGEVHWRALDMRYDQCVGNFPPSPERDEPEEASARGNKPVKEFIEQYVKDNQVVLFMKGSPSSPQCGFSAAAAGILAGYGKPIAHVNVLADPDVREGVKQFSSWPTMDGRFPRVTWAMTATALFPMNGT